MNRLTKDDPVYYKVEVNKLIKQAKQNGLEVGYEINSSDNKIKTAKVLFMNDIGEIAAATVYEEAEKASKDSYKECSQDKQKRINCNIGEGVNNWDCYSDCAFWDGEECTYNKDK
jgi:hypothetical protein